MYLGILSSEDSMSRSGFILYFKFKILESLKSQTRLNWVGGKGLILW